MPKEDPGPIARMIHQPLSENLVEVLATPAPSARITPNDLLLHTEGRGLYVVIVVLALPFLTPIPIGLSLPFGLIIAALSIRLLGGKTVTLPNWLGGREIPPRVRQLILGGGVRSLRWIEKWIRPRRSAWMGWAAVRSAHAGLLIFMALVLALPLPIPLTNTFPALAIILISLSMMEEDGVAIFLGYLMTLVTVAYFIFWAEAIQAVFLQAWAFAARLFSGIS